MSDSFDEEEQQVVRKKRPPIEPDPSSSGKAATTEDSDEDEDSDDEEEEKGGGDRGGGGNDDSDEEDEDSDDDEDSDEEGEIDNGKGGRKRKRSSGGGRKGKSSKRDGRSRFLDQEAAVGGDDDDDEEDDEADSGDELTEREAEKLRQENLYKPRARTHFENMLAQQTDQNIEEHYRAMARVSASRTQDFYDDAAGRQSALTKQSLLPTPGVDTCMWRVKVKKNQEMPMVMSIIDMARKMTQKKQRVGITAAIFNGIKGHVLIEARNEADASAAIRANARYALSQRLEVVSYRYMPTSLAVSEKIAPKPLKTGQWVRFKRGLYKGDLARVIAILEGGSKVVIEMIPRINYEDMARNNRSGNIYIVSGAARPPQKFFSASDAREHDVQLHRTKHPSLNLPCDVACNLHYLNGYLVKEVKPESLQTENVNASVEEVTKHGLGALEEEEDGRDHEERLEAAQRQAEETQEAQRRLLRVFEVNDTVKVISGELRNLVCKVLGSDPTTGTVSVRPIKTDLGLPPKIELQASQLANHVDVGQHIKVLDGMFAGETGMVQALLEDGSSRSRDAEPIVSVLTDGENKEIRVRLGQVKESAEVATGLSSVGGYAMHDMVCYGYQRFGVIIRLARDSVQLLDTSGVVQTIPLGELQGNRNYRSRGTVAYDSMNNKIQVEDQVTVTDRNEHHKKSGSIKHIMGNTLWIHTKQEPHNAGIFVTRTRSVSLQNLLRRNTVTFNAMHTGQPNGPPGGIGGQQFGGGRGGGGPGGGGGRGGGFGARQQLDPLVGKLVKVTGRSEYKGQTGTVRSIKGTVVFVDLESGTRPKTVKVDRASVALESQGSVGGRGAAGAAGGGDNYGVPSTPWYTGRTPMHGGATPMHGAATPMHGSATPALYGSSTPALGSQTPRYGAQTPSHNTPSYGGQTPRHEGYQYR